MKLDKANDGYVVVNGDGRVIAKLEKNSYGTHGHSNGWQTYCQTQDGRWMWAGVDARISGVCFTDPPHFNNLREVKEYYGISS